MASFILSLFRRLGSNPYFLLFATMLMWSANGIAGRLAVGQISPMAIVSLRWLFASGLLVLFAHRQIVDDFRVLRRHLRLVIVGGAFGFTAFNALFYAAAHFTSAVNMTILQGALPVFILTGAVLFQKTAVSPLQAIGIAFTLAGVVVVAARGDLAVLMSLTFNFGDILLVLAGFLYAVYTLSLKNRPAVSGIGLFAAMAMVAFLSSLPLIAWEAAVGQSFWPTTEGWVILLYITIFPSFLAQLGFLRAIELVGPGRTAIFTNLVPIFGPFIAVAVLGEPFHLYHAAGLALVLFGIGLVEYRKLQS